LGISFTGNVITAPFLSRVGGRKTSVAKAAAARKNGRKGGRPPIRSKADPLGNLDASLCWYYFMTT
jgi:hypothetical protein